VPRRAARAADDERIFVIGWMDSLFHLYPLASGRSPGQLLGHPLKTTTRGEPHRPLNPSADVRRASRPNQTR
jgi:hypothetical protein